MAGLALTACSEGGVTPSGIKPGGALLNEATSGAAGESYVIIGADNVLPSDLRAQLAAIGGTLLRAHPEIGVAVAAGGDGFRAAAAAIPGVESVAQNLLIEQPQPDRAVDLVSEQPATSLDASGAGAGENVASSADSDPFYFFQWAPGAVSAPEAWNAGYRGAGARVAILDGGLHNTHPDLVQRVDVSASKSFACFPRLPVCPANTMTPYNSDLGTLWHGTHVAGIVAASDNNIGVVGIAPEATLIGVKVLHGGTGQFSWSIDAIMYASTPVSEGGAGAHVINMSLGAMIDLTPPNATPEQIEQIKADVQELDKAISRAADFAWKRGTIVIAAAGNARTYLGKQFVHFPSMSRHVVAVGATGPLGWAFGQMPGATPLATSNTFWRQASYTNFGKKGVDLSAPGGDSAYPGNEVCPLKGPLTVTQLVPCWAYDLYLSTSRGAAASAGGYTWTSGTSMASPVVAGVAALIVGKSGGIYKPAAVKAALEQGALDLGKPGNDDIYGLGWVNAWRSVNR